MCWDDRLHHQVRLADSVFKKDTQGTRLVKGLPMVVSSQQEDEQRLALAEGTRDAIGSPLVPSGRCGDALGM